MPMMNRFFLPVGSISPRRASVQMNPVKAPTTAPGRAQNGSFAKIARPRRTNSFILVVYPDYVSEPVDQCAGGIAADDGHVSPYRICTCPVKAGRHG